MKPEQSRAKKQRSKGLGSRMESVAVAHELNNLLTLVLGYSQLIVDGTKRSDPNRQNAEQILKAGERAAVLTRRMTEAVSRAGIPLAPRSPAGHNTSGESSKPDAPPVPGRSRRAARRA